MNFFGMGPAEIIIILVVALIIFGPGRLPELGATVGRTIREFKKGTSELTQEFTRSMNEEPTEKTAEASGVTQPQASTGSADAEDVKVCAHCSARNPSANRFCGECGVLLSEKETIAE